MHEGVADVAQAVDGAWDLVAKADRRHFPERAPAMVDSTLPLPGLLPVAEKDIVARFDDGSDGGALVLRARSSGGWVSPNGSPPALPTRAIRVAPRTA